MKPSDYIDKGSEYIADILSQNKGEPPSPEFRLLQEYLRVALNKELMENQRKYQDDSIGQMRGLVLATWILAGATVALALVDLFMKH